MDLEDFRVYYDSPMRKGPGGVGDSFDDLLFARAEGTWKIWGFIRGFGIGKRIPNEILPPRFWRAEPRVSGFGWRVTLGLLSVIACRPGGLPGWARIARRRGSQWSSTDFSVRSSFLVPTFQFACRHAGWAFVVLRDKQIPHLVFKRDSVLEPSLAS
jgi:hypothetical protein